MRTEQNRTERILFSAVIILLIIIGVILAKSDFITKVEKRLGFVGVAELTPFYKIMLSYHKRMDGNIPDGAVVFIGDSITQGLAVSSVSAVSVNYGIGSDSTFGVLKRLSEYKSLSRARAIIIAIGVNDLGRRNNSEIINNYKSILDKLPSDVFVIVNSILPINEKYKNTTWNIRINNLNTEIKVICRDYKNVEFSSINSLLVDSKGNLLDLYHVGDGVHLTTSGYNVWINELKEILKKHNKLLNIDS